MNFPMARSGRRSFWRRWSRLSLALLAAGFVVGGGAQNLPEGLSSQAGSVTSGTSGTTMTITQAQQRAIAHWDAFNIGEGYTVNINQPGASSVLLNRVVGNNVSNIFGALNANGHVYLINPAGVIFRNGAQVNVGGIVASTLDLAGGTMAERNQAFLNGGALDFEKRDPGYGTVNVQAGALVQAQDGSGRNGLVVFMADAVTNDGIIRAQGGKVALATGSRIVFDPFGDGLTTLRVDVGGGGDNSVQNSGAISANGGQVVLLAKSAEDWIGNNFGSGPSPSAGHIEARGGEIFLDAGQGRVELSGTLDASGEGADNGGSIRVRGGDLSLNAELLAAGSQAGGHIETSGESFAMGSDFSVNAGPAPGGQAGTWLLDPVDINIEPGAPPPSAPVLNTLYDSIINSVLDTGTSVVLETPAGGTPADGNVNLQFGVQIRRTASGAPVNFTVNADRSIRTPDGGVVIESTGGPLNVSLNADARNNASDPATGGGRIALFNTRISTNGGDITLHANWADASLGGWAIDLNQSQLDSGGGAIAVDGFSSVGGGVQLRASTVDSSDSGTISITGVGQNPQVSPGNGVALRGTRVQTADGDISIQGHVQDQIASAPGAGVVVDNESQVASARGNIDLTGSAESADAGSAGLEVQGSVTASNGNVSLRAANDGNVDALVIDPGSPGVSAGGMLNLRPGAVSASGVTADRLDDAMTLGSDGNGFSVSAAELGRLSADGAIVLGSAVHAGAITVDGGISLAGSLTLQNEGAGSGGVALQAPVTVTGGGTLALLSAGGVTQDSGVNIVAGQVLARSTGGGVLLGNPGNSAGTVSGSAANGDFTWVNAGSVQLAPVSAIGAQAAVNAPQAVAVGTLAAQNVRVQTLSGNLALAMPLSSSAGADLVAAGVFQNPGSGSAGGAPWRVWASTWTGESRGGMSGSGPLPNLYNCLYAGSCGVSVPVGDNHFIYAEQPVATVTIGDLSRPLGRPNPPLVHGINGLILGDGAAAVTGSVGTAAGLLSPMGDYPITGSFTSPAGYAVTVNPGTLRITEFVQPPVGQVPTLGLPADSATFAANLAGAPICLASEPLAGDGELADGDMLAREWSRVRTRPRLTNCLQSSRREACSDF